MRHNNNNHTNTNVNTNTNHTASHNSHNHTNHNRGNNRRNVRREPREKITSCQRCGAELTRFGYSLFDSAVICDKCKHKETLHPDYEKAIERHRQEILAGNYAFKGIGKPDIM